MKKIIALLLVAVMLLGLAVSASALNYQPRFDNEATFETLEEARVNGPAYLMSYYPAKTYVADPAMDEFPAGTAYVYRSANYWSCNLAAYRMNTNLLVYVEKKFESKDEALAFITDLGLVDIIDQAIGSIVLVTPANGRTFDVADQYNFYLMQSAMTNLGGSARTAEGTFSYADNTYYGGLTYRYIIGIDGGATFVNTCIAPIDQYLSRTAGILTFGGNMPAVYQHVAAKVPAFLINADASTIARYAEANNAKACITADGITTWYNQNDPVCAVATMTADTLTAEIVKDAYYNFLNKALRAPALRPGTFNGSRQFTGYAFNQDPFILAKRNAIVDGKTADGLVINEIWDSETFKDIALENGNYCDYWLEILPEEVLDGSAPDGTIPLWLANHGGGDDPLQYCDEIGLLTLAGEKRFAIVAPEMQSIGGLTQKAMPALVHYMLDKYPALDASRIYTTGYSMGGGNTLSSVSGEPALFAAAVPMAAVAYWPTDEEAAAFTANNVPMLFLTSSYDYFYDWTTFHMRDIEFGVCDYPHQINLWLGYYGMDKLTYDFDEYPLSGFVADIKVDGMLGDYPSHAWFLKNADGIPMVGLSVTEHLTHCLNPDYGTIAWDFCKHYSRDLETGAVIFNPYVD